MEQLKKITDVEIKQKIMSFIKSNFLMGNDSTSLDENDSFLEEGIIDSTGVLELVSFVEEAFNIRVEDEELIPDNLDSVNKLDTFIRTKINTGEKE